MKAVAVSLGKPPSVHLRDIPKPSLGEIPDGRGVLVKVLRIGLDGTDKEINTGEYGSPPPGDNYLVLGNKVVVGTVNANREHFEAGVRDLAHARLQWPGWLPMLLTHPVEGLGRYTEAMRLLTEGTDVIKVFVKVFEEP